MTNPSQPASRAPGDRRDPDKGRVGDRRKWHEFRQNYPGFVFTLLLALMIMIALDAFLFLKRGTYRNEVTRLHGSMSEQEKAKTDAIIGSEQNKTRIAIELAKRQAKFEKALHLSVSVDSGKIYLEREGAVLREMAAAFGPETKSGPDSIPVVIPRGEMTIARIDDDNIALESGTIISTTKSQSPAQDTAPIPPGTVRITKADLDAIRPSLTPGMPVYFY